MIDSCLLISISDASDAAADAADDAASTSLLHHVYVPLRLYVLLVEISLVYIPYKRLHNVLTQQLGQTVKLEHSSSQALGLL